VRHVYDLHEPSPGELPEQRLQQRPNGTLTLHGAPARSRYVLTDANVHLAGRVVAQDSGRGIVLLRARNPLLIDYRVKGIYVSDTWSGPKVTYTRFHCTGGKIQVLLQSDANLFKEPTTVAASTGPKVSVPGFGPPTVLTAPLRPRGGTCRVVFTMKPTAIPAAVIPGNTDSRVLGAHFLSFRALP